MEVDGSDDVPDLKKGGAGDFLGEAAVNFPGCFN